MCEILLLGGTTEGRQLAEYCADHGIAVMVSVVSEYGEHLLPHSDCVQVLTAPMNELEMEEMIRARGIRLVIDATHPYAVQVTDHARTACSRTGAAYERQLRRSETWNSGDVTVAGSMEEAAEYLKETEGPIFVTTGSKELAAFSVIPDYKERLFVRVIPALPSLLVCQEMGLGGAHVMAMQGPFSEEMNQAMMRQIKAAWLVTKEAGAAGGFEEKLSAAASCGVHVIVVGRPVKEEGITFKEAKELLRTYEPRVVSLIGTGMGGPGQMTEAALHAAGSCDVLFGASRMLHSVKTALAGRHSFSVPVLFPVYQAETIMDYMKDNRQWNRIGILYSGDTGFYSGSRQFTSLLEQRHLEQDYKVSVYPGISSLSYLCAAAQTQWEDVYVISLHGRTQDVGSVIEEHEKVFFLLDRNHTPADIGRLLILHGRSRARITVGERLSYETERIITGTPDEICGQVFDSLCVMLVQWSPKQEQEG